ncbi:hypothetical protein B2K_39995 [Paenibacillus mucilaginosus K02]|uniref:Uncharacterized protein n=1 Tax=Paenibacillus mucilaginosus K02 TaxID=997761 RepID=R9UNC3_9BACL|nr:hypothetical protein B2K_39995 [Paenibacillus mucilaginosus K02]
MPAEKGGCEPSLRTDYGSVIRRGRALDAGRGVRRKGITPLPPAAASTFPFQRQLQIAGAKTMRGQSQTATGRNRPHRAAWFLGRL